MQNLITPLLKLPNNIFAKMELNNPGGSHKVRAARYIIQAAIDDKKIIPGKTTVIEKTGGNFGFGLLTACKEFGINVELAVGLGFSLKKRQYLESMGATLIGKDQLQAGKSPKEVVQYHLDHAEALGKHYYFTDQFNHSGSLYGHLHSTGPEIAQQLKQFTTNKQITFVSCAGTGASLMGIRQALIHQGFDVHTCLVEPENNNAEHNIFSEHRFEGMNVGVTPPFLDWNIVDSRYRVNQADMLATQQAFSVEHGYLVGNTSAACLAAAQYLARTTPHNILTMIYDSGLWYDDLLNHTKNNITCAI
ncbi:PLP-dependent cysteine synthase family protein [Pseudomonas sp. HK3]